MEKKKIPNSDGENNFPITFHPMPKRFMVWDKFEHRFHRIRSEKGPWQYVFDIWEMQRLLERLDLTENVICQSTNLFDEDDEEIFEGSILKSAQNKIGIVKCLVGEGRYIIYYPNYGWTALDALSAGDNKVIGHILSNPELLEEK